MKITLTKAEALAIQANQIAWYNRDTSVELSNRKIEA